MHEIKLKVKKENVDTLMGILENLKEGLINNIELDGKSTKQNHTRYQPKTNKVVYEHESGTNDRSGKYLSPLEYKKRLKK